MEREELLAIAIRHDTTMSRAMLRALGVEVPERAPKPGTVVRADKYDGIGLVFKNKMRDGRDIIDAAGF